VSGETFQPADAAGVAAKLKWANDEGLAVAVHGAGTKQSWRARDGRTDVVLSTLGLNAPADHVAGDLVATVSAGTSLDAVNDILRRERQWLPLDPASSNRATIGGIISTNDSGPRRHRFGTPRDLIIGIEIALADGRIAKAGGRVVKNVAGYDLSKLLCGSLGSLAVVTSATFKLAPLPPVSATLVASLPDARSAGALAVALGGSTLTPSTVELQSPPHRLLIRFETSPRATERQVAAATSLCATHGAATEVLTGQAEADAWSAHERRMAGDAGTVVKLATLATDVAEMLSRIETLTAEHGVGYTAAGRAALGVIFVRLDGDPGSHAAIVGELRREATARRGSAVLLAAPADLKERLGAWGPNGDAVPIMRAVKARFDPRGTLNPGREPWESGPS
jgi:glycolate dehydrogenase FAD-binding subunit